MRCNLVPFSWNPPRFLHSAIFAIASIVLFFTDGRSVIASHISELSIDVEVGAKTIGQIRLHVGTDDFSPTGKEGIGRAGRMREQSGFYPADNMTLEEMAQMVNEHHFNWLQIVKTQPASHEAEFGPVPHADPSDDPDNTTPRDDQPWYLNEGPGGTPPNPSIRPPFDLPPGTATLLEFQDFPTGIPIGEMISFNTYLVSIINPELKTYDVHAGFMWKVTNEVQAGEMAARNHVTQLMEIGTTLTTEYQIIARDYRNMEWRLSSPTPLPGDYNNDGLVNAADYVTWRNNEGTTNPLPNDPIGGTIGQAQYDQWVNNFGAPFGNGTSSNIHVPEPVTVYLLTFALLVQGASHRRRNHTI